VRKSDARLGDSAVRTSTASMTMTIDAGSDR
jgi:hypothetical protein